MKTDEERRKEIKEEAAIRSHMKMQAGVQLGDPTRSFDTMMYDREVSDQKYSGKQNPRRNRPVKVKSINKSYFYHLAMSVLICFSSMLIPALCASLHPVIFILSLYAVYWIVRISIPILKKTIQLDMHIITYKERS